MAEIQSPASEREVAVNVTSRDGCKYSKKGHENKTATSAIIVATGDARHGKDVELVSQLLCREAPLSRRWGMRTL